MKVQLICDEGGVLASVDVPAAEFVAFALRKKRSDAQLASELIHMANEVTNPIEDAIANAIAERVCREQGA